MPYKESAFKCPHSSVLPAVSSVQPWKTATGSEDGRPWEELRQWPEQTAALRLLQELPRDAEERAKFLYEPGSHSPSSTCGTKAREGGGGRELQEPLTSTASGSNIQVSLLTKWPERCCPQGRGAEPILPKGNPWAQAEMKQVRGKVV